MSKYTKDKKKSIEIRISEEMHSYLKNLSEEMGRPMSSLVRQMISFYRNHY